MEYNPDNKMSIVGLEERLKRGIWPKSIPLWMAAFYVALFIIRPWEKIFPWMGIIYFERIYGILMVIAVFLSAKKQFRINFQTITVILFIFAITLSTLFARNFSIAWPSLYTFLTLVVFYFLLSMVIRTPYELAFMVTCYIVTMTVYLAKSQWEFFIHGQHRYDMGVIRMTGIESTFGGPNALAMSIVVSLPMLIFLWSIREHLTYEWPSLWCRWFPKFLVFYSVLAVSSIILTNSRSGMLSFVLFVFLVTIRGKNIGRKMVYVLLGVVIISMLWLILPNEKKGRLRTIWDPETSPAHAKLSADQRIEGYKAGLTMFERFPLTGVGIGNFVEYRIAYVDSVPLNAHNLAGQVLGETGIVGSGAFLFMVAITVVNCFKIRNLAKRNPSNPKLSALSGLGLACRDAVILLAFEGLFGHNLLRFNWLWLAAFSSLALQFGTNILKERNQKI